MNSFKRPWKGMDQCCIRIILPCFSAGTKSSSQSISSRLGKAIVNYVP